MSLTSDEIIAAAGKRFMNVGQSFRMHHHECPAVSDSSDLSRPALNVTRSTNGWVWHCHRCKMAGKVWDSNLSPRQTMQKLDKLSLKPEDFVATEKPALPADWKPINHSMVPDAARQWIWSSGVSLNIGMEYGLGWSDKYQRVIIPVYSQEGELHGWVGREVKYETKAEREKAGCAKYINRKPAGSNRMYFVAGTQDLGKLFLVLVEDVLSAIKVHAATGLSAMALLTTSFDDDLLNRLRTFRVYLWLDGDMLAKSVKTVARMRSLGILAHHVHTPFDPKEYSNDEILLTLESAYEKAKSL